LIVFGRQSVEDYDVARSREWIVGNGLGGYASSTIIGLNTRGYHGLLVASLDPPLRRLLLLSKIEEEVVIDGSTYRLSTNRYAGAIFPEGFRHQEEFGLDPFPRFLYRAGGALVEKSLFMVRGENATVVTYRILKAPSSATLRLYPLVNCRDFHGRTRESALRFEQSPGRGAVTVLEGASGVRILLTSDLAFYTATGVWYRGFVYEEESARGYPDREDLYNPGFFQISLKAGEEVSVLASTREFPSFSASTLRRAEEKRLHCLSSLAERGGGSLRSLALAADLFVVRRGSEGKTIVAGYHWFGDWGRDAMIALPGLTLVTGRFHEAKMILRLFLRHLREGLIPNHFSDLDGSPQYSSVDASLWLFYAVYKYLGFTKDLNFVGSIFPALEEVVEHYVRGTLHDIRVDSDGLVRVGEGGLTWMDARVDGRCVTPRKGKPVEVSALWYNGLMAMKSISKALGHEECAQKYSSMSRRVRASFEGLFWNERRGCLFDCVDGALLDDSVRPNQVLAVGLPFPLLSHDKRVSVVQTVERELLTPYGLRSLSPLDPAYRGVCVGDQRSRDLAYHQGTVWPWLIGPFLSAYLRVNSQSGGAISEAGRFIEPLLEYVRVVGSIPEIFDGDPPYHPRGCIAQAWSVGEVLRAYVEDVLRTRTNA
jgi:predicted glycogen debranching enzyme